MREEDLKARGFPLGDPELLAAYKRLCGDPAFIIKDPEWVRQLMFNEVEQELRRLTSGAARPTLLAGPPLGSWHTSK